MDDLCEALVRVASEVVVMGRPGKVVVTLSVTKPQRGDPTVIVQEDIRLAPPKPESRGAFYFVVDGAFHAKDPRQPEMAFRVVGNEPPEVKAPPEVGVAERQVAE